ncbi:MAG: hypothetical protein JWQ85_108 [Mucilaginibacter sp.]|nr:hypothetical protein [Mucilaginibacter sp.]
MALIVCNSQGVGGIKKATLGQPFNTKLVKLKKAIFLRQ